MELKDRCRRYVTQEKARVCNVPVLFLSDLYVKFL